MEYGLNKAHRTALELLKIVDDYCVNQHIIYTLSGGTLISLGRIGFECCDPMLSIAVEYEGFKKILKYLTEYCAVNTEYSVHDYNNSDQFYTCDIWFVKKSRVKLDESRKNEEFYYGTHLSITPLYYAGNTKKEWKAVNKFFRDNILPLYFRKMLKKKPVFTYLKLIPRRIRTNTYLKKREFGKFKSNIAHFENREKSEYIYYPRTSTKYWGINVTIDVFSTKISELTFSSFWSKVDRIDFYGVKCYCVRDKEKLISLYSKKVIENVLKPVKSEILLAGGEELRRVQLIQLELLTEFDRICRKYNLKYNINFGTLIGAMRHKGFIPWDDDIDVTMYYKDCDRLYEIMERELNHDKYFYRCPQTEPYHHIIFNHLEHKGTTYTKAGRNKLQHKMGVFIDIFPMYPAAPNFFVDFFHTRICRFWRTALWSTVGADSEKNSLKRFYYRKLALMGTEKCRRNFLRHATRYDNKNGRLKFWTSIDRSPYNVDLVRKDNFDEAIELEFEGRKFYAPKHAEGSLEFCFSPDWKLYPNVSGRVPTHDVIMDIGDLYSYEQGE